LFGTFQRLPLFLHRAPLIALSSKLLALLCALLSNLMALRGSQLGRIPPLGITNESGAPSLALASRRRCLPLGSSLQASSPVLKRANLPPHLRAAYRERSVRQGSRSRANASLENLGDGAFDARPRARPTATKSCDVTKIPVELITTDPRLSRTEAACIIGSSA
jgi:hypothetical protein